MLINAVNERPIKSIDEVTPDGKEINDNQIMLGKNNCDIFTSLHMGATFLDWYMTQYGFIFVTF